MGCRNSLADIWPDDLYFVIGRPGSLLDAGGQVFTLPSSFSGPNGGSGWKIRINRNNTPLDYLDQGTGDSYFSYDTNTRVVTLSVDVSDLEKFMVQAYKPSV